MSASNESKIAGRYPRRRNRRPPVRLVVCVDDDVERYEETRVEINLNAMESSVVEEAEEDVASSDGDNEETTTDELGGDNEDEDDEEEMEYDEAAREEMRGFIDDDDEEESDGDYVPPSGADDAEDDDDDDISSEIIEEMNEIETIPIELNLVDEDVYDDVANVDDSRVEADAVLVVDQQNMPSQVNIRVPILRINLDLSDSE
jgi:hypothetical protein